LDSHEGHISAKAINAFKRKFDSALGASFSYEFSQGDLDRIQTLINDLREQISASTLIDDEHKSRLLKRLERTPTPRLPGISDMRRRKTKNLCYPVRHAMLDQGVVIT
jgi:hypothetical protein